VGLDEGKGENTNTIDSVFKAMDLVFYLSGEHATLPKSEVLSFLGHREMLDRKIEDLDQILVCSVNNGDLESLELLGMTHSVLRFIGSCEAEKGLITTLSKRISRVEDSFSVRVKRIKHYSKNLSAAGLEKSIGDSIEGGSVDLEDPSVLFKGFLTSGRFVFGEKLLEIQRSRFEDRNPQNRPFFHPSSLSPILSRTLCNISGVMGGKRVLDPFCGTGGILIEAGLLGADVFGVDLDERMVRGARENLVHYDIEGCVERGDSTKEAFDDQFDVVITDPPYGRASTTMGRDISALYSLGLKSIYDSLKEKGIGCIISPHSLALEDMAVGNGFSILETYLIRVHKSLTRKIVLLKK
jgi:tRNA (guanine10-N2)-dimethyltransferase